MYTVGDFSFIDDMLFRNAHDKTYQAITNLDGWDFMRSFTPNDTQGFIYSSHEMLDAISSETDRLGVGHSAASFGITMRSMEMIAKEGWQKYVQKSIK